MIKQLTEADVEFTVECLPEDTRVRGNAVCSGDPEDDRAVEDQILRDLESGNDWAWCTVRVTARWGDFEGTDYLGCCSYQSEEDFSSPDGYLPQMKSEALARLNEEIARTAETLKPLCQEGARHE